MRKAFWQLHVAIVLAGFTGILGRLITLDEFWLVFWRIGISGLLIWAWVLLSRRRETISGRDRLLVGFNGGIIALHWVAFFGSIKYANVSVALVCFSTVGFFTAILEPLFYRQLPKVTELLLGLMAIVGISLIFHFDPVYKKGIVLGLAAALLGAWFTIQNRRFMQRMNAPTLITWQLTGGGLLMFLLIPIWQQHFSLQLVWPSLTDWIWLLLLTCLCTLWAFHLLLEALKRISAFTVNLSYNLEPVYGILMAFFFFREYEQFQASFYWGGLWIVMALAIQTWRMYRKRDPDTSAR